MIQLRKQKLVDSQGLLRQELAHGAAFPCPHCVVVAPNPHEGSIQDVVGAHVAIDSLVCHLSFKDGEGFDGEANAQDVFWERFFASAQKA
ncbi:hypothetical protein TthSNM76_24770 (plasmid) [Thermus thermophilus]|nr:hypothetical protein TthSNM76_24770 [Thermus thermophilus]